MLDLNDLALDLNDLALDLYDHALDLYDHALDLNDHVLDLIAPPMIKVIVGQGMGQSGSRIRFRCLSAAYPPLIETCRMPARNIKPSSTAMTRIQID